MSEAIGLRLRRIRTDWGLSLRDVEERSSLLANKSGDSAYLISASWLARIEREAHQLTASKLVALAAIYNLAYEDILGSCMHLKTAMKESHRMFEPNTTVFLDPRAHLGMRISSPAEGIDHLPVPEQTRLLDPSSEHFHSPYRHAILGRTDRSLDPMIKAGSILEVHTQKRAMVPRKAWSNEFDRPVYMLMSHEGYACGWCEVESDSQWLTLIPHPLSHARVKRWKLNAEVEVVGRVTAVHMRLGAEAAV